jgi:DNA-binding NarL/FixJ family response regulator
MNSELSNIHGIDENGARKVSVMLVDDDPIFLQIVAATLRTHHRDKLDVVGTARSSEECILQAQALIPQVVLMDLNMPGRGGLWAIPLLQVMFPETRVIALTSNDSDNSRRAVLAAGGTDLVSKAAWQTDLIPAITRAVGMRDMNLSLGLES